MKRICMMALAALLVLAPAATEAGEKLDNPEYASWKKFKVGTSVKHRMVTKAGPSTTKMETTTTLKSKTDEKLVLSTATVTFVTIPGQGEQKIAAPAQDRDVPAKFEKPEMPKDLPDMPKPDVTEGEETLKILGKSYKCKWIASTLKMGETTTTTKTWTSDELPGMFVKMTSSTKGPMTTSTETVIVELKVP